jgi:hypothetical protein
MIVLLMATWFAQWRYVGDYRIEDVSIFIVNGTLVFLCVLQLWYFLWGVLYKMYLFGVRCKLFLHTTFPALSSHLIFFQKIVFIQIFMVWPLFFMYMLSNMLFQIIVIRSYWIKKPDLTVKDVTEVWGHNSSHWYDFLTLEHFGVVWYLNPLLWALVFSCFQAISHAFEGMRRALFFFLAACCHACEQNLIPSWGNRISRT